jgi:LacI family transcriptional regulator
MRHRTLPATKPARPHVALLIETSLASGRDILRGIARYVREHDPWSLYHEAHGLPDYIPAWLRRWKGDGIIARIQDARMAKELARLRIPVVDVLDALPDSPFSLVHVDNRAIAKMAAEHLLERELRHFAFFGIAEENWSQRRYEGLREAVARVQSEVFSYNLPQDISSESREQVHDDLAAWIAQLPKPIGVLVCCDQRGPLLLEACRRAGARVPDDVAVVGVDDDQALCELCDPPLSSIQAGHTSVGYQAAALLEARLRSATDPAAPVLIKPQQVIARVSTDMQAVTEPAIAAALRLIREEAHTGLKVEAIARRVGVSRSVLQRSFRRLLKRSIHEEILMTRIKRARELLVKTDLPIATIAERAGFNHQEYMGGCVQGTPRYDPRPPAAQRLDREVGNRSRSMY